MSYVGIKGEHRALTLLEYFMAVSWPWSILCSALRFRLVRTALGASLCAPSAWRVPGAKETWGPQCCRAFCYSQLSADWTAEETAPVAYAHATPPPPPPPPARPPCTPPTPPPTDTPLHPLFSSSGSSSSSSLSPVQCELGLGRIHWQTLPLH